jgi:hypothetical protein
MISYTHLDGKRGQVKTMVALGKTYDPVDERIVISSDQGRFLKRENYIADIRDKRSGYAKRPRF